MKCMNQRVTQFQILENLKRFLFSYQKVLYNVVILKKAHKQLFNILRSIKGRQMW